MRDPALRRLLPTAPSPAAPTRGHQRRSADHRHRRGRCAQGAPSRGPRQVSRDANVFGDRPMPIAPCARSRTRPERGRPPAGTMARARAGDAVALGGSLSAHEFDVARDALDEGFVDTPERLRAALERTVADVDPKGRRVRSPGPSPPGRWWSTTRTAATPSTACCATAGSGPRRPTRCWPRPSCVVVGPGRGRSPMTRRRWTTCNPVVDRVPTKRGGLPGRPAQ